MAKMLSKEFKQKAFPMAAISLLAAVAPVVGSMTANETTPDAFKASLVDYLVGLGNYLSKKAINDGEFTYLMSEVGKVLDAKAQ